MLELMQLCNLSYYFLGKVIENKISLKKSYYQFNTIKVLLFLSSTTTQHSAIS